METEVGVPERLRHLEGGVDPDRNGKERRTSPYPGSRDDTRLAADEIRAKLRDKTFVGDSETVTVEEALKEFYAEQVRLKLAAGTLKGLSDCMANHLVPRFGKMLVADLRTEDVKDLVNELVDEGYERTPGQALGIMKRTLAFCVPKYLVRNVLADQPIKIAPIDREPIYIPTVEEMQALHGALETRRNSKDEYEQHHAWHLRRLMILMASLAGLRRGEMQGLHWSNINPKTRMIEVRHSWSPTGGLKPPKTKAGLRDIPLDPAIAVALKPVWDMMGQPEDGMIFMTSRGGHAYGCMYESYFKTLRRSACAASERRGDRSTA